MSILKKMTHGSLFSGIGGFDLAAEWMGWDNVFHCEWNEFGQKVLKYYWPKAISYGDITKTDFTVHRGRIDIVTGGFPCQPFSLAGKRRGTEDNRYLWKEMLRAIQQIQPQWVVGENVFGIINWDRGMVFRQVQTDLETEGYEVQTYVLPACAVNAPHRRDRIWFVAHHKGEGWGQRNGQETDLQGWQVAEPGQERDGIRDDIGTGDKTGGGNASQNTECDGCLQRESFKEGTEIRELRDIGTGGTNGIHLSERANTNSNSNSNGLKRCNCEHEVKSSERGVDALNDIKQIITPNTRCGEWQNGIYGKEQERQTGELGNGYTKFGYFDNFPTTEPTIRGRNDGLPPPLSGITFSKHRNESIKAYGNAIVPEVALQIFKSIQEYENKFQ